MRARRIFRNTAGLRACVSLLLLVYCSCARQATQTADPQVLERYLRARSLYAQQNLDSALALLLENHRRAPGFAANSFLIGKICYFRSDPARAEAFWRQTLEGDPGHIDSRKWLARLYLQQDRPAQAAALLVEALASSSEDAELLLLMGKARRAEQDLAAAIEFFQKAQAFSERLAEASLELAGIYLGFGLKERAEAELRSALALLGDGSSLSASVREALERLCQEGQQEVSP